MLQVSFNRLNLAIASVYNGAQYQKEIIRGIRHQCDPIHGNKTITKLAAHHALCPILEALRDVRCVCIRLLSFNVSFQQQLAIMQDTFNNYNICEGLR